MKTKNKFSKTAKVLFTIGYFLMLAINATNWASNLLVDLLPENLKFPYVRLALGVILFIGMFAMMYFVPMFETEEETARIDALLSGRKDPSEAASEETSTDSHSNLSDAFINTGAMDRFDGNPFL